jgi:hypothetical protein
LWRIRVVLLDIVRDDFECKGRHHALLPNLPAPDPAAWLDAGKHENIGSDPPGSVELLPVNELIGADESPDSARHEPPFNQPTKQLDDEPLQRLFPYTLLPRIDGRILFPRTERPRRR